MILINGAELAEEILQEIRQEVEILVANGKRRPHLAAVLVGNNPASLSYVTNKVKSCETAGFRSSLIKRDENCTEQELISLIEELNNDPEIDGFIVQLPLPRHIDADNILLKIDPKKDVDGFHPLNFGRMAQGLPAFLPATPSGILQMLERYKIETDGKHCVVIGRSNIVGNPMSILMARKAYPGNCTVTIVHSRTSNLKDLVKQADIIIAAIGIPKFVTSDMVKEGAIVIDVGINRVADASTKSGFRLVGDVDFEHVAPKASFITPVPKGVGPMTVCALMINTLKSAKSEIY
ncbi:MAG TPA: tetrahydrofolate dehydrogenase/cyclohydrolase catalytic domain-containing protein [Saprospiraceae bacterium]|nr:bifunctional 5,10-methylene-tetrahydrofolate dehydrogenase/5,10-methylene-tetrahydrofolate cyclohydrolase [Saprospiraceae bacterium]MCC6689755.1 bifunctional 5,10-methylene-tetrahydrofolate dehydrogenase/5,10-methylene-tetrahydrofolate cyclohydrolase [Saprospiraceae bacterium]HMV23374.1 tetrahydrofolate dehydrogenase/cyclohydrolase catalytic domain-containing protein [Saprospiraceae bacterium]HMW75086.1 tetrahydrofolate dehydrogenase/cyclohydrolase catalytic domain-containing protein [Saprosp